MNEPNASLDDLTVTVDCTPRILTQGAALRIEAKLSGEAAVLVAALDLFILDEAGNAKVEARGAVRPYPSGQPRSVASSGPAGWGEVSHGGEIASGHAGQYGQKIILHGNAQAAARFHHRENGCDLWSGLRTAYV